MKKILTAGLIMGFSVGLACAGQQKLSDLEKGQLQSSQGEQIGEFEDVVVDLETGAVSFVIVASDDGKRRPVPLASVEAEGSGQQVELSLKSDKEQLQQIEAIQPDEVAELGQEQRAREIFEQFGEDYEAHQQKEMQFAAPPQQRSQSDQSDPQAKQLEQKIEKGMTQAGVESQQAKQEAEKLAQKFSQEQPDQQQIEQEIEQSLTQAGVDQQKAQQEAQRLSQEVQQEVQFGSPSQQRSQSDQSDPQAKQLEQKLEKGMTQAGVESQQAKQEARKLAQKFSQEQPDQQQIQQEIEQSLTQAGVDQQKAQQEAQRLSQEVQQEVQFGSPSQQRQTTQSQQQQKTMQQQSEGSVKLGQDLTDSTVVGQDQEEIGKISDLIIDMEQGHVSFALIEAQDGQEQYAVPLRSLEMEQDRFSLNISSDQLQQAETISEQEVQTRAQEHQQMSTAQLRQSPEVFRYQDEPGTAIFGTPGREQEEEEQKKKEEKKESKY